MSDKSSPSKLIKRNEFGLLENSKVEYVFNEDGLIDWRKMVKPEFLVANRQNFERKNKSAPSSIEGLEDRDLLILLGGIKELAQIRGYTNVKYDVSSPAPEYVVATCSITWIPNYETEGKEVVFSAIGDASPFNTSNFAKYYLGPIAENRAFVRCVRNFLKINIVSQEEVGATKVEEAPQSNEFNPKALLERIMKEKSISFDALKSKLVKEKHPGAEDLQSIQEISNIKVFELIERLQSIKK